MTRARTNYRTILWGLVTVAACLAGYWAGRMDSDSLAPPPPSPTSSAVDASGEDSLAENQEALAALGYLSAYETAPEASGVLTHDAGLAAQGYNLFTSGHAPEAYLMTMDGAIVHRWRMTFDTLWPDIDPGQENVSYWRRAHLYDDGSILGIFEPFGIFKLRADSSLVWKNACGAHHDVQVLPDGRIFTLTREPRHVIESDGKPRPILEDFVVELSPDGEVLRRVSIFEALRRSAYRPLLKDAPPHWDVTHTNSLKYIGPRAAEGGHPAFRAGRFLLSLRELDTVAVLDFESEEIVWALKGMWRRQHEATLLENDQVMVFDNLGQGDASGVIAVDAGTHAIMWRYGYEEGESLYSETCGTAARLPGGTTLIVESNAGRAIEVNPDGRIVWEYVNPFRMGANDSMIPQILFMERLPYRDEPEWLGREP